MQKKRQKKQIISILMIFIMLISVSCNAEVNINNQIDKTANELYEDIKYPTSNSVGGEWAVIGVMKSDIEEEKKQDFAAKYYDDIIAKVKSQKGILSEEYYTEYARAVMGVCTIGKDPKNIVGYNIVELLDDYENVTKQGINAVSYALIASNIADIKLKNEEKYISLILQDLESSKAEQTNSDYIAMELMALSDYTDRSDVKEQIDSKLEEVSRIQEDDGSFGNCESTAEIIFALNSLKINILEDERFEKRGKTLLDGILAFKDDDGFLHLNDDENINQMSTEKALLALEAIELSKEGKRLYDK